MKIYITSAVMATLAITASANDTIPGNPVDLREINVVAPRSIASFMHSSLPVYTVDATRITETNPQTSADLLTADGRLTVQKSQFGGGSPSIRGFESSRVLLVIDGVRMNNLIYRGGHLQNVITIDPSVVSKVDILYGPSSVVYGSDALGGTIAFQTKSPELAPEGFLFKGSAYSRYGTACNESTWHLDFNLAGEKFASFTSLSFSRFGDLKSGRNSNPFMKDDSYIYRKYDVVHDASGKDVLVPNPHFYDEIGSGYNQYDLLQKFLIKQNEHVRHLVNFQFSNTGDVPRYDRLTDMKGDKPKFAQWYYGPQTRLMGAYTLTADNALGADVASVTVAYQLVKESRHNRKLNDPWLGNRRERVNIVSLNSDWIKVIGRHSITAGIDGSLQFLKSTADRVDINTGAIKTLDTRYPDGADHLHNIDIFGVHRWNITPQWIMNEGIRLGYSSLRANFISDEFYPFFTKHTPHIRQDNPTYCANVGINYLPTQEWKLGFDLSTAYRVPNIDDVAKVFDSQPGMVVMPNPDVRPEKTITANLTASFMRNNVVEWDASVFGTYLFDAIALSRSTFDGKDRVEYDGELSDVYSNRNNRLAYILGFTTGVLWHIDRNFKADGTVSYAYGNIVAHKGEARQPLDHVAPVFGRVGVSYNTTDNKVKAEVYSLFNGKKPLSRYNLNGEDNIGYATVKGLEGDGLPAWFTLNLRVSYNPVPAVTLQGGIENLLDTEYRTFGSGINAPGRNFFIALRTTF
ncbi:MAG: TonB-dependent receptor [Muribaculaceae bacterium]|nr:TonB-dependent receptor [Muribaculaceae bacterium]